MEINKDKDSNKKKPKKLCIRRGNAEEVKKQLAKD